MSKTERNIGNEAQAQAIADAATEAKEEKQAEAAEASDLKRKISQRREEKIIHLRVEGQRVPFGPPGGEADAIMDMMGEMGGVEEEELSSDQWADYTEARDRIVEVLGEKCKDETLDEAFWRDTFSFSEREEFFGDLMSGGIEGNQQRS